MSDFKTNPHHLLTPEQFDLAVKARIARENARKSTGPQTPEGKAASAANAPKYGFAGARLILDDDEREAFDAHLQAYMDCLLPENQIECDLVPRAIDLHRFLIAGRLRQRAGPVHHRSNQ